MSKPSTAHARAQRCFCGSAAFPARVLSAAMHLVHRATDGEKKNLFCAQQETVPKSGRCISSGNARAALFRVEHARTEGVILERAIELHALVQQAEIKFGTISDDDKERLAQLDRDSPTATLRPALMDRFFRRGAPLWSPLSRGYPTSPCPPLSRLPTLAEQNDNPAQTYPKTVHCPFYNRPCPGVDHVCEVH